MLADSEHHYHFVGKVASEELGLSIYVCVCFADEPTAVGPHLRECQRPGSSYADAGPCREDHSV